MTNAEQFKKTFGIYAEEFWSYTEKQMLAWINTDVPDINVGDMISRQKAIDALCRRCDLVSDDEPCTDECNDIKILRMLPSAQQDLCEYCHEDSDGYVKPVEKNCHAFIHFGMDGWELSLKANGWHGSAKIKYCPMCGRKLKNDK